MVGKSVQRARWPLVAIAVTAVVVLIAAFMVLRTMPPRVVVMATGTEGGAYHEIGKRYREILARAGVELRLRQTGGSVENVELARVIEKLNKAIGHINAIRRESELLHRAVEIEQGGVHGVPSGFWTAR